MWHKRKRSFLGLDMDRDLPVMSVVKAVAVSALVYQAAKYVMNEFMEDE